MPEPTDNNPEILPAGHVAVPADEYEAYRAAFEAGSDAQQTLATMRFNAAFRARVAKGVEPSLEAISREVFDLNEDLGIRLVAALPATVNVAPIGRPGRDTPEAPEGIDPQNYAVHQKTLAYIREHPDVDYRTALSRVSDQVA
jgi:hypothetical protein